MYRLQFYLMILNVSSEILVGACDTSNNSNMSHSKIPTSLAQGRKFTNQCMVQGPKNSTKLNKIKYYRNIRE